MSDVQALFDQLDAFKLPPVEKWHPEKSVDIDIRIQADGRWFYRGSEIQRHRIVKLFSTVLRLEGEQYFLVTPPVKYRIDVVDVPFIAVEVSRKGEGNSQTLHFRTNMDEVVRAGQGHAIEMRRTGSDNSQVPYIMVRDGLYARIARSVFYEMAEWVTPGVESGQQENRSWRIYSDGICFDLS